MRRRDLLLGGLALPLLGATGVPVALEPTFIFDTDLASDCDDVGDLANACYVNGNVGRLIGVNINSTNAYSAACAQALLNYAGIVSAPVWQYSGAETPDSTSVYTQYVAQNYGSFPGTSTNSVTGYRTALAAQPNGSVIIINTGYGTSLAQVLASPADGISSLTGVQLIAAKVKAMYWEAGWLLSNASPQNGIGTQSAEFNIAQAIADAQYICANWPSTVPLIWCGNEQCQGTYNIAGKMPAVTTSPFWKSYSLFNGNTNRTCWAFPCWSLAFFGGDSIWQIGGSGGTMTIDNSGNNTWSSTAGPHGYASTISNTQASANAAAALFSARVLNVASGLA